MLYAEGGVVDRDMAQAAHWLEKAAEQGNAAAQSNLGVLYANGQGVPASDEKAARWLERAAQQGDALAQSNLASLYASGKGVERSLSQAYFWMLLAAGRDSSLTAKRDSMAQPLSAAERARTERQAAAWKAKPAP